MAFPAPVAAARSWTEFVAAVDALADTTAKGDAFEQLVAHHLRYDPKYRTKLVRVWRHHEVPAELRARLRLPGRDMGIDLVAETYAGEFWAIQAKYRASTAGTITFNELSTFSSLTFHVCAGAFAYALVCTTTERITDTLTGLNNLGTETAETWAALPADFFAYLSAPATTPPPPLTPRPPRPHQTQAIERAVAYFATPGQTRGKLIHPCGAGKSLTAYWIARELDTRRVLIAVPSLALVRQTLETWMSEALADGRAAYWLCVCSDDEIASDFDNEELVARIHELALPCDTDPAELEKHLRAAAARPGLLVVLTTYQSSPVLAQAARAAETAFDLCVCDEAHKTTGAASSYYAHLLHDENLPLPRRLFMTATERRFASSRSDDIVSMDDPDLYGETIDLLTFKAAIAAEPPILCDYRLLTIGVRESEVRALVEENRWLDLGPDGLDEVTSLALASLVALRRATTQYGVRHTVSFHSSIARASRFRDLNNRLNEHLPDAAPVRAFHVTGKMGSAARARELERFMQVNPSLVTNARCLTEGVDVPGIDCVFFADPKGSTIDIVQASGRALRLAKGKERGYILLPLVVPDGATPDDIAESTGFRFVLSVLRALATHDDRIIESVKASIAARASDINGPVRFDFSNVIIPCTVRAEDFSAAIEAHCWQRLEKLDSWSARLAELEAFKMEFGHVRVPRSYTAKPRLVNWVVTQRALGRRGLLPAEKENKLKELGLSFGAGHETTWSQRYEALRLFHQKNGHCEVPTNYPEMPGLGAWVGAQRQARHRLLPQRVKLLEDLGFTWDLYDGKWNDSLARLTAFKATNGHCNVPQVYPDDPPLGRWVIHQRSAKLSLSADKIKRLDELRFDWNPAASRIETMIAELATFRAENGHCDVPQKYQGNPALGTWLSAQRGLYRKGKLPVDLASRLESLGVVWMPHSDSWAEMYERLREFKEREGHCIVPLGFPEKTTLGAWVDKQRGNFRRGTIKAERRQLLDNLGFVWNALEAKWASSFGELCKFKEKTGHCRVPESYPENPKLKSWAAIQRTEHREGKLATDRIQKLDSIGFDWCPRTLDWESRLRELEHYKSVHGHLLVPKKNAERPQLGRWLAHQRELFKAGKLNDSAAERLKHLGAL